MAARSDAGTRPASSSTASPSSALLLFGGVLRRFRRQALGEALAPPPQYQPVNWQPPPASAPVVNAPQPPPRLEPKAKALFVEVGLTSTLTPGFSNADLARVLLQCEDALPPDSRLAAANRAIVQRIALVSRMIDSVTDDPNLPARFKAGYERLRFTLIKSALADPNFFAQRQHPLRASAARLAQLAARLPDQDQRAEEQIEKSLAEAVRDYDLAAAFVQPILHRLQPLAVEVIRDFVLQLRTERGEREAARRACRLVMQEIELRIGSHGPLHPRLRFVIDVEWAAVLTWRVTSWGEGSPAWRTGLAWLDELVRQHKAIESGAPIPTSLLGRLEAGLREAGRPVAPAVQALLDFSREPQAATPAALPDSPGAAEPTVIRAPQGQALMALMRGDRWFRVFDHDQQKMRWLKTNGFDSQRNMVLFAELDGSNGLAMSAAQFVEDLRQGLSAPNNPDMETTLLVTEVRSQMPAV